MNVQPSDSTLELNVQPRNCSQQKQSLNNLPRILQPQSTVHARNNVATKLSNCLHNASPFLTVGRKKRELKKKRSQHDFPESRLQTTRKWTWSRRRTPLTTDDVLKTGNHCAITARQNMRNNLFLFWYHAVLFLPATRRSVTKRSPAAQELAK